MTDLRCGTKCFIVTIEQNDGETVKEVPARSQADARKMVRKHFGKDMKIRSVRKK
ncbi:MAG TPA: hypothetical protein H9891_08945 [Candidatus Salinicoccus stercoripullorum]|uniref:Uncharacterized protein n=1 Tax=Candidatus Salinicoccus stercoripullorum TaxID=2838756 RepID=A0A9D1U0A4_9STAP|nr:hypothetical protein [Candidatus Salinicoccus stercoripullorum]